MTTVSRVSDGAKASPLPKDQPEVKQKSEALDESAIQNLTKHLESKIHQIRGDYKSFINWLQLSATQMVGPAAPKKVHREEKPTVI